MEKENPNIINQSSLACIYCGKSYKKYSNVIKHALICELKHIKPKQNNFIDLSHEQLIILCLKLSENYNLIEKKMNIMEKEINELKQQLQSNILKNNDNHIEEEIFINVNKYTNLSTVENPIEWLNNNIKPVFTFDNLYEELNRIIDENIFIEAKKNVLSSFHLLFSNNIYNNIDFKYPICSSKKMKKIYIYRNDEIWTEMDDKLMNSFMLKIENIFRKYLIHYKKTNEEKIKNDEKLEETLKKISTNLATFTIDEKFTKEFIKQLSI